MGALTPTPFEEFDALSVLFGRTRAALDSVLAHGRADDRVRSLLADETIPHVEAIESGFRVRLRASDGPMPELRGLVARSGLTMPGAAGNAERRAQLIETMQALSGAGGPRYLSLAQGRDLAALDHARIAMALLPRTEAAAVHFPGRRSYADIAAPTSAAEFLARVEEVERTLWRVAIRRPTRPGDGPLRRVYAFFDAGERLSEDGTLHA